MSGDTIRFAYLPIYMELQLGTPDWLRGVVIAVQSLGMLVFIPIMGVLADRFGAQRLVVVNVLLGVGANLGFHGQQRVVPDRRDRPQLGDVGDSRRDRHHRGSGSVPDRDRSASTLYFSAIRFSAAIGGVAGGLGVGWFGVPGVFLIPALLCVMAAIGLLIQAVVMQRASDRLDGIGVESAELEAATGGRRGRR